MTPKANWGNVLFPEKAKALFRPAPYKVFHGGRGSAKTWSFCRALLTLGGRKKLFILCTREIQKSIKDSVHKTLADHIDELGIGWFYHVTNTEIIGENGTKFVFYGIRNNINSIKSMEAIDICAVFESTFVSHNSWEVLLPTVRRDPPHGPFGKGSEVWIEFNPELASDETYKRWVAKPPSDTIVVEMNFRDNPWFPTILKKQKEELKHRDYDSYLTVWEGKTRKALQGAIYAKEIAAAILENRIGPNIHFARGVPVDVSFDLGRSDMMAMWFWQQVGTEHHAIDFYGNTGFDFSHFIEQIEGRKYNIRHIYLPHDADNEYAVAPLSIAAQARKAFPGEGRVRVIPRIPNIALGINAVRLLWPRIYINEITCSDGVLALQHYQYGVNEETGQRTVYPLHNFASNPADALRTYAEALREGRQEMEAKRPSARRVIPSKRRNPS